MTRVKIDENKQARIACYVCIVLMSLFMLPIAALQLFVLHVKGERLTSILLGFMTLTLYVLYITPSLMTLFRQPRDKQRRHR